MSNQLSAYVDANLVPILLRPAFDPFPTLRRFYFQKIWSIIRQSNKGRQVKNLAALCIVLD
jgi:hypothetical protein